MPKINKQLKKLVEDNISKLYDEVKDLKETKDNTFDVIATTDDVDRDGEIIKTDGWETENWFKNPVVLIDHSYRVESIAWKGFKFYKDDEGRMRLKWVFAPNEAWKLAKELYNGWFLKAVSVWFIVKQRNQEDWKIIERAELLEISFVAVPANPEAISMDWKTFEKCKSFWLVKDIVEDEKLPDPKEKEKEDEKKELDLSEKVNKLDLEIKEIKTLIKNMSDDNDNNPNTDEEKKLAEKQFYQNLVKWANEVLCQIKKG